KSRMGWPYRPSSIEMRADVRQIAGFALRGAKDLGVEALRRGWPIAVRAVGGMRRDLPKAARAVVRELRRGLPKAARAMGAMRRGWPKMAGAVRGMTMPSLRITFARAFWGLSFI